MQAEGDPATLDGQIKEVRLKIKVVESEILKVTGDLEQLPHGGLSPDENARKEERLQLEKQQLREKENGLQKKENLLLEILKQQNAEGAPLSVYVSAHVTGKKGQTCKNPY